MFARSLMLLLALAASVLASSPADAVAAAARDLAGVPAADRPHTRYLSLYAVREKEREAFAKVLLFHANQLSREAEFGRPRRVTADLVAVDLRDYAWKAETWERLEAAGEPYFHALVRLPPEEKTVAEPWPGGIWPADGKDYPRGFFKFEKKISVPGKVTTAAAPWLDPRHSAALITGTRSKVPVVRADWFLHQTAVQLDRKAGYYDFLGLGKKQADFEKLIGADRKKSQEVKREVAGLLARSGVTLQNRVVTRFQSITGGYWVTADYRTSVDRQNVLRLLDRGTDPPDGDATEQYGVLPSGLFAYWLGNAQGERADAAPDFIASDGQASGTDRRVHVGLSCIRCHVEGIRPVDDYARKLYRGSVRLATPDYEKFKRLRQLYLSDLERHVKRDQADYAEALARLNGTKPAEMARLFAAAWDSYAERDLLPDDAARELGVPKEKMLAALKAAAAGGLDPVLAQLIQDPSLPLRREHWQESYSAAQAAIRGYRP